MAMNCGEWNVKFEGVNWKKDFSNANARTDLKQEESTVEAHWQSGQESHQACGRHGEVPLFGQVGPLVVDGPHQDLP